MPDKAESPGRVGRPKVLFVSSEALPFAATGGLADVAGSLPQALTRLGAEVRVVMPLYSGIKPALRKELRFDKAINVTLAWRNQYCGIFTGSYKGVVYHFIDNEQYFKREGLYGFADDGERFAFFSKAALEILPHVGFTPDIIHSNDWHTGMVPVFYRAFYNHLPNYLGAKLAFTIHNIQYQGQMDPSCIGDLLGLGTEWKPLLEYGGSVNLIKAAVEASDTYTTVSPTYCREIQTPEYGHGLDAYLLANNHKARGILNGIDTENYDPTSARDMSVPFDSANLKGKVGNKVRLQEELGLFRDPDQPVFSMITRLAEAKGLDLVVSAFDGIMEGVPGEAGSDQPQFILLGTGDPVYEDFLTGMQERYPGRVACILSFKPELAKRIYSGSDIFLMPSRTEACGLSQMIALRYGTLPIVRETGGLKDTITDFDSGSPDGNGFTFAPFEAEALLATVKRALDHYNRKDDWKNMIIQAMHSDNSWDRSAQDYLALYGDLAADRNQPR